MVPIRKVSPRAEYRLLQVQRINDSVTLAQKFPELKSLTVSLEYFDPAGLSRRGGMKFKANIELAKSVVFFDCPSSDCAGGDYDLSEGLARAVSAGQTRVTGEMHCQGVRHNKERHESAPCRNLLRYKLRLAYL